jgi:hypothetical protein
MIQARSTQELLAAGDVRGLKVFSLYEVKPWPPHRSRLWRYRFAERTWLHQRPALLGNVGCPAVFISSDHRT